MSDGRTAEDTLAIQAVVVKYGFLVDDRDWDSFDEVFTDDAVVDMRLQTDPPQGAGPFHGVDEIVRSYQQLSHPNQHMLVSHVIDDVSSDEVVVRSKALFPMPGGTIADIMYRDVVVRTPAGWRIRHKSLKRYPADAAPVPHERQRDDDS